LFEELPIFLLEFLHLTGGVHQFLLARKEGMTLGTDVHFVILPGREGPEGGTTSTGYGDLIKRGMDIFLHLLSSFP
jgi:hypothetical protein